MSATCSTYAQTNTVLFDFESDVVPDWRTFGTPGTVVIGLSPTNSGPGDAHSGSNALTFTHNQAAVFGGVRTVNSSVLPVTDFSPFTKISYWVKSSTANTSNDVAIEIREGPSQDTWQQKSRSMILGPYQRVEVDLLSADFVQTDPVVDRDDNVLDLGDIDAVNVVFFPNPPVNNPDVVSYFVDDVELLTNAIPTTLTVSPLSVDFGTLMPKSDDRRFQTPPLRCEFSVAAAAWRIEVSSVNANDVEGMVSPDGTNTMSEFKFHQSNFGPGDEEEDANWRGTEMNMFDDASFKRIFASTNSFKSTLGSSLSQDTSPIDFTFAVEAAGVFATNYSADVLIELVVE